MIHKVLIANRGEIACRLARAAQESGIAAVTLYTGKEAAYPQCYAGTESVVLGDGSLKETYLNQDLLIEIAKAHACDAVHPGYGFLSENAAFAARCEAEGLVFVGPTSAAIALMGDKAEAKAIAEKAGVPVVPGYKGADQSPERLAREGERVGFPLLIKASAGGGGKGMRIVERKADFAEALAACKREALAAFGSDIVLLEKYLKNPRHIEIQIARDIFGNAVYIGERECSIQRRHQKIVEEAPSPAVGGALRERMGAVSLALAHAIDYRNVGTIEFLLDEEGRFYFLEMNTRLQVEHPVTEECFGLDLAALQFALARGEPLPFKQADLAPKRHAIECRIYAEDPDNGFLPSIGKMLRFTAPLGPGIRLDFGMAEGNEVTIDFDPMLGKLIAFGQDREQARVRLIRALEEFVCLGLVTNIDFLRRLLETEAFKSGRIHTHLLDHLDLKRSDAEALPEEVVAAAAAVLNGVQAHRHGSVAGHYSPSPWDDRRGWRLAGERDISVGARVPQGFPSVIVPSLGKAPVVAAGDNGLWVAFRGRTYFLRQDKPSASASRRRVRHDAAGGGVIAPMPGKIIHVAAAVGARVEKGELLVILEAMKMEHRLLAPSSGEVKAVHVRIGDIVEMGRELAELGD